MVALLHFDVVFGTTVLVVLHVVSMLDVDVAAVVLLKLDQLVVREVELDTVKVEVVALGTKVVELVAVDDGTTDELLDENDVGFTLLDVEFPEPLHDVVDVIVPDDAVPLDVKLVVTLAVVAVEVTFTELELIVEVIVEVMFPLDVGSSVHDVEGTVVLLVQEKVVPVVEEVTGPVPVKLDEVVVELTPVPVLEKDDVVGTREEELLAEVGAAVVDFEI